MGEGGCEKDIKGGWPYRGGGGGVVSRRGVQTFIMDLMHLNYRGKHDFNGFTIRKLRRKGKETIETVNETKYS